MVRACRRAGRDAADVQLLLATKTVPPERIAVAVDSGLTLLGENRVQELQRKHPLLVGKPIQWHFIGHLQRNKVRHVINYATCIHSVDRLRLGRTLHNRLQREGKQMDILVQVNTSMETSKFGVAPGQAPELVEQLAQLDTLRIKGLMTIGRFSKVEAEIRQDFRRLRAVQAEIAQRNIPGVAMDHLSMGMSHDFELAIEEGATIIRVGTAVFGDREYPDSYYWDESTGSS